MPTRKSNNAFTWEGLLEKMGADPDFRARNAAAIAEAMGTSSSILSPTSTDNATRGRNNRKVGERFEGKLNAVLDLLWTHGAGRVFRTGAAVKPVGKNPDGSVKLAFKPKRKGGPPMNPPDFMGQLFGLPVGFDAKVSHSSETYYATREKKKDQHQGIIDLAHGVDGLHGYVIEWKPQKISFIHVADCSDGYVRESLSRYRGTTIEAVLHQWATEAGKQWPIQLRPRNGSK